MKAKFRTNWIKTASAKNPKPIGRSNNKRMIFFENKKDTGAIKNGIATDI